MWKKQNIDRNLSKIVEEIAKKFQNSEEEIERRNAYVKSIVGRVIQDLQEIVETNRNETENKLMEKGRKINELFN